MPLELFVDHQARATARLAEQYRGSYSMTSMVALGTAEHQAVEDALWVEFLESVDNAVGAALDVLGKIVGQPRAAMKG